MTKETLEELRERLLRQHNVHQMIEERAYEIYRMRGGQPGGEAQDWFHAESEVLAFLLADESPREDERAEGVATGATAPPAVPAKATATKKPRSRATGKRTDAKAAAPKKTVSKRVNPKKSTESKSKPARISKKPKKEESAQ